MKNKSNKVVNSPSEQPSVTLWQKFAQNFGKFKLTHFSLACVGAMWVLPFLYYYHAYHRTTFYQEWTAALLGVCAMPS